MTIQKTIITVTILIFSCSSLNLVAGQTTYSLFDNVEETENKDNIKINSNKESVKATVVFHDSEDTNTDSEHALLDWFQESNEPEILKTRQIKSTFRKNDPYYGKDLCNNGTYTCITLKKGDSWTSLFPNKYQRELVQRINRTNRGLWNRSWLLVPNDVNRDYMDFSPLAYYYNTNGKKTIIVDISELAFGAYDTDGDLVHWGPVNPGKDSSQTVKGDNFQVYRKGGPDCYSKKFEADIPYCIFFHEGFALHGFAMPGYPASHGCVRIYVDDAIWLNQNFADYKTRVIVRD